MKEEIKKDIVSLKQNDKFPDNPGANTIYICIYICKSP
jgi:hypothetical protein